MTLLLCFLRDHKDELGLLINFALLLATLVLIIVGVLQAAAARAQAAMAHAQTKELTRPVLTIIREFPDKSWQDEEQHHRVINYGPGIAVGIELEHLDSNLRFIRKEPLSRLVLSKDQSTFIKVPTYNVKLRYSSTLGEVTETTIKIWDDAIESLTALPANGPE